MNKDTIVAIATGNTKGAISIIRVSGDEAFSIVNSIIEKDITDSKGYSIERATIKDDKDIIDDVLLSIFRAPKSYTGEDVIEINCHGGLYVTRKVLTLHLSKGARLATNGEYTSRAFLHERIDLVQAEAINDVINATTKEAKELSMLSLKGETSKLILPLKKRIADILSLIEVNIDYPEYEDIEVANKDNVISIVDELVPQIDKLVSEGEKGLIIKEGIKVSLVGKPNVGKSSLLNALLGESKAIVTDIAGTTRDIVEGEINLNGVVLHLLDTAGIRDVDDKVESIGVNKSKDAIKESDLVIVLLDASNKLDDQDKEILDLVKDVPHIIAYNKIDKASDNKLFKDAICISALNNDITPLKNAVYERLGLKDETFKTPSLNNTRQLGLLKNVKESLLNAKEDALNDLPIDLVSVSLHDAYNATLEILGEYNQTDISKEIFSRFCVGK